MPSNLVMESVSKTLEYAYDDWCLAQAANLLGKDLEYGKYIQRAQYYKNIFDPATGFMRPKLNGAWRTPFDPRQVDFNYTEANSWQYSFYVPQDLSGLIKLFGGEEAFEKKLDELFTTDSQTTGRVQADITGLIGQYAHGNEPSHHMAYLYNYIGKPWKTQHYVERIMQEMYSEKPDGYAGNEDCGQMSAWYVLSALGFYPVTPGSTTYVLGKPLFPRAVLNFENGNHFIIESDADGKGKYVTSVRLNKQPHQKSFIEHHELIRGGKLAFYLGEEPGEGYGVDREHRPQTEIRDHGITMAPVILDGRQSFRDRFIVDLRSYQQDTEVYYRIRKSGKRFKQWKLFKQPFSVDYSGELEFYAKNVDGTQSKIQQSSFSRLQGEYEIHLDHPYSDQYTGGGETALIDLIHGGQNFADGSWQGFQGDDLVATIDLGKETKIRQIEMGFFQAQRSWIWFPQRVEFQVSTDGKQFVTVGEKGALGDEKDESTIVRTVSVDFPQQKIRYVRIIAHNRGVCPEWHPGAGGKAWLFADEILIR
jgi:hypothetical protein